MPAVLLADKLADKAIEVLEDAGFKVINKPGLSPDELKEAAKKVEGIICRSGVQLTNEIFEAADSLCAVCRAGVGVDNIDIEAASRKGVVVMNTPGANTISTAEHTFALMLALSRNIGPAYISMRAGRWDRKKLTGDELSGTTLGVIGLGRVGQAVARRAAAFEMEVLGYDPYISEKAASKLGIQLHNNLDDILKKSDYLTIHIPKSDETTGLIGRKQIAMMKPSARIINCARGQVVDMEAVVEAVNEGELGGGAFDVYTSEPPGDFSFAHNDKILATPHLGASTEAAQIAVGVQAAVQMVDAIENEDYNNALNITPVPPEEMARLAPFCELAEKLGKCLGCLNWGRAQSLEVICSGELAQHNISPIEDNAVMGLLKTMSEDDLNIVSAPYLAQERGLETSCTSSNKTEGGFTNLIELRLHTDQGVRKAAGAVLGKKHPRIVKVEKYHTEVLPEGNLLLVFGKDKPGLIGTIGEKLGEGGINIARMTFGREQAGGSAMLALNLDSPCDNEAVGMIENIESVVSATQIKF